MVRREVGLFLDERDPDQVFTVLVEGAPEQAIPVEISSRLNGPALYVDLRSEPGKRIGRRRFNELTLPLLAALLGCELDDLVRREAHRRRVKRIANTIGTLLLLVALALVGGLASLRHELEVFAETRSDPLVYAGISQVRFGEENNRLAIGGQGGYVAEWLIAPESEPKIIRQLGSIRDIAFSAESDRIVVVTTNLLVELDEREERAIRRRYVAERELLCFDRAPGANRWVVGAERGWVAIVDLERESLEHEFLVGEQDIGAVWYRDDGTILVQERAGNWYQLDVAAPEPQRLPIPSSPSPVPALVDPSSDGVVIAHPDRITWTELGSGDPMESLELDSDYPPSAMGYWTGVVAVGLTNGEIRLLSPRDGQRLDEGKLFVPGIPTSISFSPGGHLLAVGYQDSISSSVGGVRVFDRGLYLWGRRLGRRRIANS